MKIENLPLLNDSMAGCACNCWQSRKRFRCKHVKDDAEVAEGIVDDDEHNDAVDEGEGEQDNEDDVEDDDVSMGGTTNGVADDAVVVKPVCCKEQELCKDVAIVVLAIESAVIGEFDVEELKSLCVFWCVGIVSGVLGT